MLIFGGNNFDAVNELFSFDLSRREWSRIKPKGSPPSKRYGHVAVSTADDRMIIFGGFNGTFLDDVHELKFGPDGDAPEWRCVETHGARPSARDGHSAVMAPDGVTLLVYGGFDGKDQLGDLYTLDTRTFEWSRLHFMRTDASPLEGQGSGPEPATTKADLDDSDDGHEVDAADSTGSPSAISEPAPRYMHSAVACEGGMLLYGGYLAGGDFANDLWRLTFETTSEEGDGEAGRSPSLGKPRWTRLEASGEAPLAGFAHAAASDADGRMWLSGGFGEGSFSNQLHVFEVAKRRWSLVRAHGRVPSPRHKHTLVSAPEGKLLLFGGADFGQARGMPRSH